MVQLALQPKNGQKLSKELGKDLIIQLGQLPLALRSTIGYSLLICVYLSSIKSTLTNQLSRRSLKNVPSPASFSFIFGLFKQTFFTTNHCKKMS